MDGKKCVIKVSGAGLNGHERSSGGKGRRPAERHVLGAHNIVPATLGAASLHEAGGRIGAMPCKIRPLDCSMRLHGPAFPVWCEAGSNLALHHAIYAAEPGDVLVVDVGEGQDFGYWGEVMTIAAIERGIAGLVINGGVRDVTAITALGFPVFSSRVSLRGTGKEPFGSIGEPIRIGQVAITCGDLVVGDADGVVVVPAAQAENVQLESAMRDAAETAYFARLRAGETTLAIYGLSPLTKAPKRRGRQSIVVPGLDHGELPIPAASRVGRLLSTGGIRGIDRASDKIPEDPFEQCRLMFDNLREIVEAGGGSTADVVKVTVWVAAPEVRTFLNPPWIEMFPNPASRPARHVIVHNLPGGMVVQCEALAYLQPAHSGSADD